MRCVLLCSSQVGPCFLYVEGMTCDLFYSLISFDGLAPHPVCCFHHVDIWRLVCISSPPFSLLCLCCLITFCCRCRSSRQPITLHDIESIDAALQSNNLLLTREFFLEVGPFLLMSNHRLLVITLVRRIAKALLPQGLPKVSEIVWNVRF